LALDLQGFLYAGGEHGQIYRINIEKMVYECIAKTNGSILGVTLDGRGQIYVCDAINHKIIKCMPSGKLSIYAEGTEKAPLNTPNFSVFDQKGHIFFSDSGDFWKPSGRLWVKEPGNTAFPLTPPILPFPNGLFLDNEEEYLYVILSSTPEIARFKVKNGNLIGKIESVVKLPSYIIPDGISIDSNRNLWIACYKPDEILKVSRKGKIEVIMEDLTGILLNRPTNLVLKENEVLFANLGGRHIGSFEKNVKPLKICYPKF
jgi:gluconolactonase